MIYTKITELEVLTYNNENYVVGYKLDMQDIVDPSINALLSQTSPTGFIQPHQLALFLESMPIRCDYDKFHLTFGWYKYKDDFYYPNLAISSKLCIRYSIPVSHINTDVMDSASKASWYQYLVALQQTFYLNVPNSQRELNNYIHYIFAMNEDCPKSALYFKYSAPVISVEEIRARSLELHQEAMKSFPTVTESELPKEKEDVNFELPSFDYDRMASRLYIPRDTRNINFPLVHLLLQGVQEDYGVCFNKEATSAFFDSLQKEKMRLQSIVQTAYGVPFIDFKARALSPHCHQKLVLDYAQDSDFPISKYIRNGKTSTSSKTIKFTTDDVAELLESVTHSFNNAIKNNQPTDVIETLRKKCEVIDAHLKLLRIISKESLTKDILSGLMGNSPRCEHKNDRLVFHCDISNESATKRFTTSNINLQNKPVDVKKLICARDKGRKVVTIDIKSQEVVILVFAVMQNKQLKKLALEYGDCYLAFASYMGVEYNTEVKKAIKIPIVSIMNGETKNSMLSNVSTKYMDLVLSIYNLIVTDAGYREIDRKANAESYKDLVVRRGLFGTESCKTTNNSKFGNTRGAKKRQALNANFQLTASELTATSLHCLFADLLTQNNKYGLSLEDVTPILPIYDEMVFDVKEEHLDQAIELIKFYMLPIVEGWGKFEGSITVGDFYVPK